MNNITQEQLDRINMWINELFQVYSDNPKAISADIAVPIIALRKWQEEINYENPRYYSMGHNHTWVLFQNHQVRCAVCGVTKHLSEI